MKQIMTLCLLMPLLQSCITAAITGASAVGYGVAQHRTIGDAVDDAKLQSLIKGAMAKYSAEMFAKVDVDVNEARVLLTGKVTNPKHRLEAMRLAWQPEGVREVINEVQIIEKNSIKQIAKDAWITAKVKSVLFANRQIKSINYGVDTVNNVVYLFGLSSALQELEMAKKSASMIKGVERVVSHVRLVHDPLRTKYFE